MPCKQAPEQGETHQNDIVLGHGTHNLGNVAD